MKLNLRKARKLEQKIATYLSSDLELPTSIEVVITAAPESVTKKVNETSQKLDVSVNNAIVLHKVRYQIRDAINKANSNAVGGASLNSLVNRVQLNKAIVAQLSPISRAEVALETETEIHEVLEAAGKKQSHFGSTKASFSVMDKSTKENLEKLKYDTMKENEDLEDKINVINISSEVELSDDQVRVLQDCKIM
jgi:hypothetical protein